MSKKFNRLAYSSLKDFIYGVAENPVATKNGLIIGGGEIYPEINFTLPPIKINNTTMPEIRNIYKQIIDGVLKRARELYCKGLVVELELLPPMTVNPEWGIEINKVVRDVMYEYEIKYGLKSALRITPNDVREINKPPIMRKGQIWENMLKTFRGCAENGADFLSVESTGGKEIHDEALVNADLEKVIFSIGILGVRDMRFLWDNIGRIAKETDSISAGDSACGFANTAMVLAERGFIPKVFAAVVRVATVARALVAFEMGAVGPSKDCAYEGPYLKAITGAPISMEGKSASCAHFSPIGNITAAVADLWSNESVQQIKLLSDMAPIVSTEQLIYDCRLMNTASSKGFANNFRDLLTESDAGYDPQAYVLRPDVVFRISKEIVKIEDPFVRTKRSAQIAIDEIRKAIDSKEVYVENREYAWLDIMNEQLEDIPENEQEFWHKIKHELNLNNFIPSEYDLKLD
ncbi:methyltransferase MtaB domain-containing protein [Clostridium sp. JNZ X4-2]